MQADMIAPLASQTVEASWVVGDAVNGAVPRHSEAAVHMMINDGNG
jgi:hypothetical protein